MTMRDVRFWIKMEIRVLTLKLVSANIQYVLGSSNTYLFEQWLVKTNQRLDQLTGKRVEVMMPLAMADRGQEMLIKKVGGKEETRLFLENLGFVPGSKVCVISEVDGNVIINVKESRVAIGKEMALKIMV